MGKKKKRSSTNSWKNGKLISVGTITENMTFDDIKDRFNAIDTTPVRARVRAAIRVARNNQTADFTKDLFRAEKINEKSITGMAKYAIVYNKLMPSDKVKFDEIIAASGGESEVARYLGLVYKAHKQGKKDLTINTYAIYTKEPGKKNNKIHIYLGKNFTEKGIKGRIQEHRTELGADIRANEKVYNKWKGEKTYKQMVDEGLLKLPKHSEKRKTALRLWYTKKKGKPRKHPTVDHNAPDQDPGWKWKSVTQLKVKNLLTDWGMKGMSPQKGETKNQYKERIAPGSTEKDKDKRKKLMKADKKKRTDKKGVFKPNVGEKLYRELAELEKIIVASGIPNLVTGSTENVYLDDKTEKGKDKIARRQTLENWKIMMSRYFHRYTKKKQMPPRTEATETIDTLDITGDLPIGYEKPKYHELTGHPPAPPSDELLTQEEQEQKAGEGYYEEAKAEDEFPELLWDEDEGIPIVEVTLAQLDSLGDSNVILPDIFNQVSDSEFQQQFVYQTDKPKRTRGPNWRSKPKRTQSDVRSIMGISSTQMKRQEDDDEKDAPGHPPAPDSPAPERRPTPPPPEVQPLRLDDIQITIDDRPTQSDFLSVPVGARSALDTVLMREISERPPPPPPHPPLPQIMRDRDPNRPRKKFDLYFYKDL